MRVEVLAYADDGSPSPATGAIVEGGSAPATVDASGGVNVTFAQPGEAVLRASRSGDIPSQFLAVCVADQATRCPSVRGREILGTDGSDNILGTLGNDVVRPRAGNDNIKSRRGADRIISRGGGADKVKCGGGKDLVEADKKDRIGKSCERAKGARKAPEGGKKRGGKKR
jgi:Ca2+-binding RTX toxin-like protein